MVRGDGQCAGRALARAPEAVSKPTGIALKPPFGCREPSLKISSAHPSRLCKSQHAHTAQGRRRGPRARQLERPGTTHLACGACGSSWAGEHRKRTRRECPKRVVQSPRCPSKDGLYICRIQLYHRSAPRRMRRERERERIHFLCGRLSLPTSAGARRPVWRAGSCAISSMLPAWPVLLVHAPSRSTA